MSMDPAQKTWRWRVFAATWLSYAGFYFCRKPFFIVKASLGEELGWDPSALAFIGTGYLVAYTIGQFLAGAAGDRWGPRLVLLVGMAVSIGASLVFGLTNSWGMFAAFMVVNGLAQATGWSNNVGTMATWFHRRERGTVMGVWATNFQVGGVAANGLAAWVLGNMGFRESFFAGSLVLLAVWLFFLFNQRNQPEDLGLEPICAPGDEQVAAAVDEGVRGWSAAIVTNVLLMGVFYFFVKFIRYALWSWAPYLLYKNYGLEGDEAGYLSTIFDVAGIGGVVVAGVLSDRVFRGRRTMVSFLFIVGMAISCLMLYALGPTSLLLFSVSIGLVGFTLYGPDALMSGAGAIDVGSRRSAVMAAGIINGMGSVGSIVQELVFGRMFDASADVGPMFAVLLGSSVLAALCLGLLLVRNRLGRADL
jgi:sugar phosphate permease